MEVEVGVGVWGGAVWCGLGPVGSGGVWGWGGWVEMGWLGMGVELGVAGVGWRRPSTWRRLGVAAVGLHGRTQEVCGARNEARRGSVGNTALFEPMQENQDSFF